MENNEKNKYLIPNAIWESVLGHNAGCLKIRDVLNDSIICHQIFDRGTPNERLALHPVTFRRDEFLVAFNPDINDPNNDKSFDDYIRNVDLGEEYSKNVRIGVKLNSEGYIVSASLLSDDKPTESSNYLKMDGDKAQFESGAIRYTKTGKGRYDLIPGDVISDIIGYAAELFEEKAVRIVSKANVVEDAYRGDPKDRFVHTIINVIIDHYAPGDIVDDNMGLTANEVTFISFMNGFFHMLKDLAIHYENGAEKYGVDNWKKGIPVTGGDRGGSFMDSAMRHLTQYLIGLTDEPHYISCIWNCVCGLWTLRQQQMHPNKK